MWKWWKDFLRDYAVWTFLDWFIYTPSGHAVVFAIAGTIVAGLARAFASGPQRHDLLLVLSTCVVIAIAVAIWQVIAALFWNQTVPQQQKSGLLEEFALTRVVFVSRIEVDFTDLINLDRLILAFTVHAFTGAMNPIVIDSHIEGSIRWREQTEKGAEDRGYLSALAPQVNAAGSDLGPIPRCTSFQFRLEQAIPYSIALQIWQALHAKKTLHFEFIALNVKTKIEAPVTREERFPLWAGVYCRKSNESDIYVNRVIAISGETRAKAAFSSGPIPLANREITTGQRQRFVDEVKRLSLQGRSVQIKGSAHDAETRDYWHALVELFRANGMSAEGQLEDFPSYDPSGLVLVVQEPQADRLTGHAKIIFELLRSAQIPLALGHDGKQRKPDDWCYLYVGRRG